MIPMGRIELKFVVLIAAVVALVSIGCGTPTQFETIQTFEADKKIEFATATAEAIIAAGGDPAAAAVQVAAGSVAAQAQATAAAKATAAAEAGESGSGGSAVGTDVGTETEQAIEVEFELPEGPAQSGEVTISLENSGVPVPQVVKITVGTVVTWENTRGTASSAASYEGEGEQFDSGELRRAPFSNELCCFSHTFTVVGCHRYHSLFSGDIGVGAVCVVEE